MIETPTFDLKRNNFDLARLALAIVVVFQHLSVLTQFKEFKIFQAVTFWVQPVEGFFVISGFLIAISYLRSKSLSDYFEKRARRILPAYIVVVLVCAVIGVFLTKGSLSNYFSLDLLKYLAANLTFLNFIKPSLPSVFIGNPYTNAINGSLWTIKIEVMFYIALPILFYAIKRYSAWLVLVSIYISSITYFSLLKYLSYKLDQHILEEVARQLPGYLSYFVSAILICKYYQFFKENKHILVGLAFPIYIFAKSLGLLLLIPICQAVIVIYFCLFFPYIGNWGKYGDFSYGLYIWHFPTIQLLLGYNFCTNKPFLFLFLVAIFTGVLSFISWHHIEKRALRKSSHYYMTTQTTAK
jgi:peptidoglycan/LPS O-acetylase OafA/YrhL